MTADSVFSKSGHLLYVQVTDICDMGCSFCMYADRRHGRFNLLIEGKCKENLARLICESSRVGICGEGEPLNNQKAVLSLLEMGRGRTTFDLITSANIERHLLHSFIDEAVKIVRRRKNRLRIRVSLDRFHIASLRYNNILSLLERMMERREEDSSVELSFRSITSDKNFVRMYLSVLVSEAGYNLCWNCRDPLKYEMTVEDYRCTLKFQSLVNHGSLTVKDIYTPEEYIGLLEAKFGKPFTLGDMKMDRKPGLDVTINPNGGVVFYGLECKEIGNIYRDEITYEHIRDFICADPFYSTFITVPFRDILAQLRKNERLSFKIDEINNPYWIVRRLHEEYPDQLRKAVLHFN